jgi:hypothetical protein
MSPKSARFVQTLCGTLFLFGSPAIAAETWDCTIHANLRSGGTEVAPEHGQIGIEGDELHWRGQHYRIAVNNDVGVVAVFAQATTSPPSITVHGLQPAQNAAMEAHFRSLIPNPLIDSVTIAINKQDGSLRIGSVGTTQVRDESAGTCRKAEAVPVAADPTKSDNLAQ